MTGITDVHAHVLPGVDDGAVNWDMCLEMIDTAVKNRTGRIIATPHYLPWQKSENRPESLRMLCVEAERRARQETGSDIKLDLGQEIYYHVDMIEKLNKGELLTLAGSRYVLVEFAIDIPHRALLQAVSHIRTSGYLPVVAHVERYQCLRKKDHFDELRQTGARLQMNVSPIQGGAFDKTASWCKKQLLEECIHLIGSDMHNTTSRPPITTDKLEWVVKKMNQRYLKKLLWKNAADI